MKNEKNNNQDSKLQVKKSVYNFLQSYNSVQYSIKIDNVNNNKKLTESEKNQKLSALAEAYNKVDSKIKSAVKSLYNALLSDNFELSADFARIDTKKLKITGSLSISDTQYLLDNFLNQFLANGKIITADNRVLFLKGVYYLNSKNGLFFKYTDKKSFKSAVDSYSNIDNSKIVFNGVMFDFEKKECYKANLKTEKKDDSIIIIDDSISESESLKNVA